MSGRAAHIDQMAAMTRVTEVVPHAVALKAHLRAIVESPAFKGSRRSQEFLQFVVQHALDGQFDELKERTLGVELFGRSPSYDTGDDAIVRVTACDVRKRLTQFYAEFGPHAEFRVELPPGSYIPEFRNTATNQPKAASIVTQTRLQVEKIPVSAGSGDESAGRGTACRNWWRRLRRAIPQAGLRPADGSVGAGRRSLWFWNQRRSLEAVRSPSHVLPWSAVIQSNRPAQVIFCDPEIVTVQRLLNYSVSLSDYANQHYWPADMKPGMRQVFQAVSFRGASVAAVDAGIALKIDNLIVPSTKHALEIHTARSIRLGDFKTDDSFVLFGSPRSNPWVELFQEQLDFSFEFDSERKAEFVRNKRPGNGESTSYVPTAEGWGTGHAYAIVALVSNPDQKGQVLIIAGSNAEATEAAGKLATDLEALPKILQSHGIDPSGPVRRFEILLRVSTMAGSPNTFDVVACHVLNGGCHGKSWRHKASRAAVHQKTNFNASCKDRGAFACAVTRPKVPGVALRLVFGVANWTRFITLNASRRTSSSRRFSLDKEKGLGQRVILAEDREIADLWISDGRVAHAIARLQREPPLLRDGGDVAVPVGQRWSLEVQVHRGVEFASF